MESDKIEKHIQKVFKEREIQPSNQAWEKLSNQLSTSNQSQNKGYVWYGVAASLIGILVLSILYINSSDTKITPAIEVVDTPKEAIKESADFNTDVLLEDTIVSIKEVEVPENIIQNTIKKESINSNELVSVVSGVEGEITPQKESLVLKDLDIRNELPRKIIDSKVLEVVTKVNFLEENNDTLTDAEVDSLLRNAQREIIANKLFRESNNSVDAMALLATVEGELDTSFRDQIFETLKTGFLKARTALADRNN